LRHGSVPVLPRRLFPDRFRKVLLALVVEFPHEPRSLLFYEVHQALIERIGPFSNLLLKHRVCGQCIDGWFELFDVVHNGDLAKPNQ